MMLKLGDVVIGGLERWKNSEEQQKSRQPLFSNVQCSSILAHLGFSCSFISKAGVPDLPRSHSRSLAIIAITGLLAGVPSPGGSSHGAQKRLLRWRWSAGKFWLTQHRVSSQHMGSVKSTHALIDPAQSNKPTVLGSYADPELTIFVREPPLFMVNSLRLFVVTEITETTWTPSTFI